MTSHAQMIVLAVSAFLGNACTGSALAGGLTASSMTGRGSGTLVMYTTTTPVTVPASPSPSGLAFYNAREASKPTRSVPLFQQARSLSSR